MQPFLDGVLSEITGGITGKAKITGSVSEMQINGDFVINEASTHIDFLNETVHFDDQHVFIRPTLIGADAIDIFDSRGKRASLNFSLFHENFSKMNFDLSVTSYDIFRAFNTTNKDSDYFYGQIFLSPGSTVGMDSDYDGNLNIVADVASGTGTTVFIPFFDDDEVSSKDYIQFVSSQIDTTASDSSKVDDSSLKIEMNISMDLNQDADITLLMDEFSSDKIQARGAGSITIQMDKNQNFKMFGNYEIEEGIYYLSNRIQRRSRTLSTLRQIVQITCNVREI